MSTIRLILALLFVGITAQVFAQPGGADLSFNKTGQQSFSLKTNASNDYITTSYLQPDGKLLVAGHYSSSSQSGGFISRLTAMGQPDLTFGTNGRVVFDDLGIGNFRVKAIALHSNGNLVLAGYNSDEGQRPALASFLPNGSLDPDFGDGGYKIISDIHGVFGDSPRLNTVQIHPATGNIIAGGQTDDLMDSGGNPNYLCEMLIVALTKRGNAFTYGSKDKEEYMTQRIASWMANITSSVRFHADSLYLGVNQLPGDGIMIPGVTAISMVTGRLNEFFGAGTDDVLLINFGEEQGYCHSIALTADKDILLAGYTEDFIREAVVCKVSAASESVDSFFGLNGTATLQFGPTGQEFTSIAVDQNNNIMAGGYYADASNEHYWAVAMFTSSGAPVNTFSGDGKETYPMRTESGITSLHAVGGNYLLVGDYIVDNDPYETDGVVKKIDNTANLVAYGVGGSATVWATDYFATAESMILHNDKLWVCGNIYNTSTPKNGGIVVINPSTGTIDNSFGGALPGASPGAFLIPVSTTYGTVGLRQLAFQGNRLIVAATYYDSTSTEDELILMRFNLVGNSLQLDETFGNLGYAVSTAPTAGIHRVQGLLILDNGKIIVYGYGLSGPAGSISVLGFTANGAMDSFGTSGAYVHPETPTDPGERKSLDGKILSGGNLAFATSAYGPSSGSDMLVFILTPTGSLVRTRFYDLFAESNDGAYSLAAKEDQSLFVGGISGGRYTVLSLLANGDRDTTFATKGVLSVPRHLDNERIVGLYIDKQSLVGVGRASSEGGEVTAALRFTLKGRMDSTFVGRGYAAIGTFLSKSSLIASDRLYLAGHKDDDEDMLYGEVYKLLLGGGPIMKTTVMGLPNLTKTYGDAPFRMNVVTNSPAPVTYRILNSFDACATVDATGLIKLLCATTVDNHIQIEASQATIPGYSSASATAKIEINKADPRLTFTSQGGVVGETIKLKYTTNSDASNGLYIQQLTFNGVAYQGSYPDSMSISSIGEEQVRITIYETTNFKEVSAIATIYGYAAPQTPETADDNAELIYGQATSVGIDVLANDQALTGFLDVRYIDLDPKTPGIQDTYVSPSLGLFKVDTTSGLVMYTPFSGFIGSGSIPYRVTDNQGTLSASSMIYVSVKLQGEAPELKATELITPNGDGLNEAFVIGNVNLDEANTLRLFDRNGQELFTKDNYNNDWVGELNNGKQVENGVYYYVFIEGVGTAQRELKGAVEVRR